MVSWCHSEFGGNNAWYNYMMSVDSNTVISNVTFNATIPTCGLMVIDNRHNVKLSYLSFLGVPRMFVNESTIDSIKNAAVTLGQNVSYVEVAYSYMYQVGCGVFIGSPYSNNVEIHHNNMQNISADGVGINTPAFGQEMGQYNDTSVVIPYYDSPYNAVNISIHHNSIQWTGWSNFGAGIAVQGFLFGNHFDRSYGFGISNSGGTNVSIDFNYLYQCSRNCIHVEGDARYTNVTNNVIDTVNGYAVRDLSQTCSRGSMVSTLTNGGVSSTGFGWETPME